MFDWASLWENKTTDRQTDGQVDRQTVWCAFNIKQKSLLYPKKIPEINQYKYGFDSTFTALLNDLQYIWILFKSFLTVTCHDNKYQVYSIFLILKNAWLWIIGSDNKSAHTVTPGKPLGEGRGNNFRKILVTKTLWTTIYRLHTLLKHYKVIKLDILVKEAVLLFILDTWVSMWNI